MSGTALPPVGGGVLGGAIAAVIKAVGAFATRALSADQPDSTATGGNARGANAVDLQTVRTSATSVASGTSACIVGGNDNTASGNFSFVYGQASTASGSYSQAMGLQAHTQGRYGVHVAASGQQAVAGDRQAIIWAVWRGTTTDAATGVRLTANGGAAGATNVLNLVNNSAMRLRILVVAQVAATSAKSWEVEVLIRRGANAAATALPTAASVATAFGDAGLSTAAVAVTADTTNGALNITVNGVAATTIQWCAFIQGVEVVG